MRRGRDRGAVTVETLLWVPFIGLIVFAPIQLAMCAVALIGARGAADGAAQDTAAYGATVQDGQQSANDRLHTLSGHLLGGPPTVSVTRSATTATVTVSGTAAFLLPIPISWTAQAPVERFVPGG